MIIPQYWSEYKQQAWVKGKSFTLNRLGWSDVSETEAKKHAEIRVREAMRVLCDQHDKAGEARTDLI